MLYPSLCMPPVNGGFWGCSTWWWKGHSSLCIDTSYSGVIARWNCLPSLFLGGLWSARKGAGSFACVRVTRWSQWRQEFLLLSRLLPSLALTKSWKLRHVGKLYLAIVPGQPRDGCCCHNQVKLFCRSTCKRCFGTKQEVAKGRRVAAFYWHYTMQVDVPFSTASASQFLCVLETKAYMNFHLAMALASQHS